MTRNQVSEQANDVEESGAPANEGVPQDEGAGAESAKTETAVPDRIPDEYKPLLTKIVEREVKKATARVHKQYAYAQGWKEFIDYVNAHPDVAERINEVLAEHEPDAGYQALSVSQSLEQRLELKEAEMELRMTDPVFKEHEREIREWAEEEGIEIRTARDLKLAYRAWRGDPVNQAKIQSSQGGSETKTKKPGLQGAKGPAPLREEARKMSEIEYLRRRGIPVFEEEE